MNRPPIIFLGPTMPLEEARQFLFADFRPPIRRGDTAEIERGSVVGIIDGVFDQHLSVTPRELREALMRGVSIWGSSSMGALRAAEVPGVTGIGRVYKMYASGAIRDDDEVAIVFDAESSRVLSEPLVNIRFAVEQLTSANLIERELATKIVAIAKQMSYPERVYKNILREVGIQDKEELDHYAKLLKHYDLKREDAIALLDELGRADLRAPAPSTYNLETDTSAEAPRSEDSSDRRIYIWESGDRVEPRDFVHWLGVTGQLTPIVRGLAEMDLTAEFEELTNVEEIDLADSPIPPAESLERTRVTWAWLTAEEFEVTLKDLRVTMDDVEARLQTESLAWLLSSLFLKKDDDDFILHCIGDSLFTDLKLKREVLRCASLRVLAARYREEHADWEIAPKELEIAKIKLCAMNDSATWAHLKTRYERLGVTQFAERVVEDLALARTVISRMRGMGRLPKLEHLKKMFPPADKAEGSDRHHLPLDVAVEKAQTIRNAVGITRLGSIEGLFDSKIFVSQAYRRESAHSSSITSGKALTREAADVGAILEAAEQYAREALSLESTSSILESCESLAKRGDPFTDPSDLFVPNDTNYSPTQPMHWVQANSLLTGEPTWLPTAYVVLDRLKNDMLYCPRLGSKIMTTNGFAAGFTPAEATVHALCEFIERHQQAIWERLYRNPGVPSAPLPRLIDPDSLCGEPHSAFTRCETLGKTLLLDITLEVGVPTFCAYVVRDVPPKGPEYGAASTLNFGMATHPNPNVAIVSALCEAAQTMGVNVAGGREDLFSRARSLGRADRPRTRNLDFLRTLLDPDFPKLPLDLTSSRGYQTRDLVDELRWLVQRLWKDGAKDVLCYSVSGPELESKGVFVQRTLVVGFEDINPFGFGERARRAMLSDLLPR